MRKLHLIAGLLGVLVFVLSGQAMRLHKPPVLSLEDGQRMMHDVCVAAHLYSGKRPSESGDGDLSEVGRTGWRRRLQVAGSLLMLISLVLLTLAFVDEPGAGIAGRSLRSAFGWFELLGGALAHFFAKVGAVGAGWGGSELTGQEAASKLIKLCAGVAHW